MIMTAAGFGVQRAPRTVVFGAGQRSLLGLHAAAHGSTALVCTDQRLAESPEFAGLRADLEDHGLTVHVWSDTAPELPMADIDACYDAMEDVGIDVVIGIGGGSCLDLAKAEALLLTHGGPIDQYYGENAVPGPVLPVIAVPTTGGTGSEVTPVCVLSDSRRELKAGISSLHLVPAVAICDPELTYTCPPSLTASAGADAVSHLVESFTAIQRPATAIAEGRVFIGKNVISDFYGRWGLELLQRALPAAFENPTDRQARSDVMLAANAGGYALGVAGTAAAHALQYPLGALTHTPHGVGVGVLLPYVMRYNAPARIDEFAEIATIFGKPAADSREAQALEGLEAVEALLDRIGIPPTLKELGLTEDQLPYVAEMGMRSARLVDNNPRPLDTAALLEITRAAYAGDRGNPF
ncbi:alcohol dehydrogenase [Kribbella sp. VKM Ac-2569]|uniref:iron-containing alcohol dehydrogenase n=1 Tax=Kribbella sp. VKM Ac-2569 TaxID=2512220 RepID=UPI0010D4413B|nr:iron-containing alcohol dehydrogenase [Kribbella sp. VKM Ac-2569]RZT27553.1 alcohol dehydrogenase [Kribbella sp. VKM Ac-2569]